MLGCQPENHTKKVSAVVFCYKLQIKMWKKKTLTLSFAFFKVSGTQLNPCSHYMERVVALRGAVLWKASGIRSWQAIEVLFQIMLTVSTSWIHHTWPHSVRCWNMWQLRSSTTDNTFFKNVQGRAATTDYFKYWFIWWVFAWLIH